MCHCYRDDNCLPKGKGNVPKYNTFGAGKFYDILMKELREITSPKGLDANSSINNLRKCCKNHALVMLMKKNYKNE